MPAASIPRRMITDDAEAPVRQGGEILANQHIQSTLNRRGFQRMSHSSQSYQ